MLTATILDTHGRPPHPMDSLVLKLSRRDDVTQDEQVALRQIVSSTQWIAFGRDVLSPGGKTITSTFLIEGFAAQYHLLVNGRRQITALFLPGDVLDIDSEIMGQTGDGVVALTGCRVARVPHEKVRRLNQDHQHLSRLLRLMSLIEAGIHAEWLVGMGRRTAKAHMAHLFCEVCSLLEVVHLAHGHEFDFPVTQVDLGDVLGLSSVHVNRVLQELRATDLLEWQGGRMKILDWDGLRALAEFDDRYLHLHSQPR